MAAPVFIQSGSRTPVAIGNRLRLCFMVNAGSQLSLKVYAVCCCRSAFDEHFIFHLWQRHYQANSCDTVTFVHCCVPQMSSPVRFRSWSAITRTWSTWQPSSACPSGGCPWTRRQGARYMQVP
jgi:hypothetical protein